MDNIKGLMLISQIKAAEILAPQKWPVFKCLSKDYFGLYAPNWLILDQLLGEALWVHAPIKNDIDDLSHLEI